MKSFMASPSTIERKWYVVDATGHTLGRLSSEIAKVLRGKNKPTFTPHIDTGAVSYTHLDVYKRQVQKRPEVGYTAVSPLSGKRGRGVMPGRPSGSLRPLTGIYIRSSARGSILTRFRNA